MMRPYILHYVYFIYKSGRQGMFSKLSSFFIVILWLAQFKNGVHCLTLNQIRLKCLKYV
jgi:hypothetical protein